MKRILFVLFILTLSCVTVSYADNRVSLKTPIYIEAVGRGIAPSGTSGAWAKILARRAAMVDLQRNLLQKLCQFQADAGVLHNRLHVFIIGVELLDGEWNGEVYKLKGRVCSENGRISVLDINK